LSGCDTGRLLATTCEDSTVSDPPLSRRPSCHARTEGDLRGHRRAERALRAGGSSSSETGSPSVPVARAPCRPSIAARIDGSVARASACSRISTRAHQRNLGVPAGDARLKQSPQNRQHSPAVSEPTPGE
jgi:hypothetical protein